MNEILNIGLTIKTLSDAITLTFLNEADGEKFYESKKKQIQRMKNFNINEMNDSDYSNFLKFISKFDAWSEWAKTKDYINGAQQNALGSFYMTMFEAASYNMPLNKNMTEHFLCYALSKVLYEQMEDYKNNFPNESKCEILDSTLTSFDFFSSDERYKKDLSPITNSFKLLSSLVKDMNSVIKYWEDKISETGKRNSPPNLKSYIKKWSNGTTPSWNIIKLFFDNDLSLPDNYFSDEIDIAIKKNCYKAFKRNLVMAFIITNLFDSLEQQKIITKETRQMIRNGTKMYYREFYIIRNKEDTEYSQKFETEAKNNLMFRTLFYMLDASSEEIKTMDFLQVAYHDPNIPYIID